MRLNKNVKQDDHKLKDATEDLTSKALEDAANIVYDGFVAQEVEAAAKKLGFAFSGVDKPKNEDGLYGLRYDNFVVPLVKAVQELSKQNDALKEQNAALVKRIEKVESMLNINAGNSSHALSANIVLTNASLEQNAPNPFTNATTIHYSLPKKFVSAELIITDNTGKTIKQVKLSGEGKGTLTINASSITAGAYNYLLIIDGKIVGTKQMMMIN